jgi:enamine deaminase RidA (YjgF/YER057c/UK114 family)
MATHIRKNPDTLFDASPWGFHQVQISTGQRMIHIAGQASLDRAAEIVGAGDLAAQMAQTFANIALALESAGAQRSDIASLRIYIVDYVPDHAPIIVAALLDFFGAEHVPPNALIGVQALAIPGLLVEIEATAIA